MENLETPYDIEAEFIECTVCEKSIRGDTLYKIHLTTPGHIKKEESYVTAGLAVRKQTIPDFQDILQYLDYLKLDEPIIGLDYLEEVPSNEPQAGPKYICRLCHLTANLPEMVHHVIGRKHRQKYVEIKRPDLVTWDKQSLINQGGKIIRARAEIIERQNGRGNPVPMTKRRIEGKFNTSRVSPRQTQKRDQNFAQSFSHQDLPSLVPKLMDYKNKYPRQVCSNTPSFHTDKSYNDRQMYQWEESPQHDHVEEDLCRGDYRNNMHAREYMDPGNCMKYKEEYTEDPQGRGGVNRYDPWKEAGMPYGQTQHGGNYPEEAPSSRRPYQERDSLEDFSSEEVRCQQDHSEYQHPLQMYPEDKRQWSPDRESNRHDNMRRASRQGSSELEPKESFPTPVENEQTHHRLFNIIKDYQHKLRIPHKEVAVSHPGPSRTGPPSSQRRVDVTKTISGIPEPFKRFLTGMTDSEGYGKRKRKSRFSDATAEEVEMTREMLRDQFEPPNPKFGRPASAPLRPEIHTTQHPDYYSESQSSESYHEGGSGSVDVFDLLKGIEIENAEEADFLKNKLCSLLKEFKSKKMEKALQKSQDGAVRNNDYNPQPSPRHQHERTVREDSDLRPSLELSFKDDGRGKGWMQHDYTPDEQLQEHHHSVNREPAYSHRKAYEEAFGSSEMPATPHATYSDEPVRYPERFQELMYRRDYQQPAENYRDSHATSPLHREENSRICRDSQYSKNLDKITCTLLELVSRKKTGDF